MTHEDYLRKLLQDTIRDVVREILQDTIKDVLNDLPQPKEEIKYLTRQQVCSLLHISLPTLTDYVKSGLIRCQRIGKRVLFEESDIRAAVREIPNMKYNRKIGRKS